MTIHDRYEPLLFRSSRNPILTSADWPYPVHSVFNPGAIRLKDGTTLLLCRCEDRSGFSHLCAARSDDGETDWRIDPAPTLGPLPNEHPEELWGVEDPRITYVKDLQAYVIAYTAFSKGGPGVALAITEDFVDFERLGLVMQPDDKDAAIFPHKFNGQYALIHRPTTDLGSNIWISYSPDLRNWGGHKMVLPARRGAWWDANKIGLSPPPIETEKGWLMMYHGVRRHASGAIYRLGLALFDINNPEICLLRGQTWMLGPVEPYEIAGDVPYVVFPCGYTVADDGDTLKVYYGAADTCVGVATGSIRHMLDWLERNGSNLVGVAGTETERRELTTSS